MKKEVSAGGVVFQKKENDIYILIAKPTGRTTWVLPKGKVGDTMETENQTLEETALREVKEEVGAVGNIIDTLSSSHYFYTWDGEKREKKVYYFLMEYVSGDISIHDWEMEEVEWVEITEALKRITYKTEKTAVKEAAEKLACI